MREDLLSGTTIFAIDGYFFSGAGFGDWCFWAVGGSDVGDSLPDFVGLARSTAAGAGSAG